MKIFNKYDFLSYIAFGIAIILVLLPNSKKIYVGKIPLQEIAVCLVAIGGIFTGLTSLQAVQEGKKVEFNRLMMFAGFGMGGMFLLAVLFKWVVYLLFG